MDFDTVLLALRLVLHVATGLIVAMWRPDEQTRYRFGVSLMAACFAGSCLALSVWTITNWGRECQGPQIWMVLYSAFVFAAVAWSRGNIAKLLPRIKWSAHL